MFTNPPVYHWYLSVTAIFLNVSWSLHNVIAWMKNKPFLGRKASIFYIGTVILVQPYWVVEIVANVSISFVRPKKRCRLISSSGCTSATTMTSSYILDRTKPSSVTHGGYLQY
jgi:hypothetical protein